MIVLQYYKLKMVFIRSSFNEKRMQVNQNTLLVENMGKAMYIRKAILGEQF